MKPPLQKQALSMVEERLSELLGESLEELRQQPEFNSYRPDILLKVGEIAFVVEWKGSGGYAMLSGMIDQVRRLAAATDALPLIAVPYMGESGRRLCESQCVNWLDLSGNARIIAPGLRIIIEGKPNRFVQRGRRSSPFAPKSSRVARWLLMHPQESFSQREIAVSTGLGEGYVSRIVGRLEVDGLVSRDDDGALRAQNPDLLLDSWAEDYDFGRYDVIKGHVAARSGEEVLNKLAEKARDAQLKHAATGLAGAWLIDKFASFRIATLYLERIPSDSVLERLGVRREERGANVWLVIPRDEGVFHGAQSRDGIECVHPVQAWLDLRAHPERAAEAAEHLRANHLNWGRND